MQFKNYEKKTGNLFFLLFFSFSTLAMEKGESKIKTERGESSRQNNFMPERKVKVEEKREASRSEENRSERNSVRSNSGGSVGDFNNQKKKEETDSSFGQFILKEYNQNTTITFSNAKEGKKKTEEDQTLETFCANLFELIDICKRNLVKLNEKCSNFFCVLTDIPEKLEKLTFLKYTLDPENKSMLSKIGDKFTGKAKNESLLGFGLIPDLVNEYFNIFLHKLWEDRDFQGSISIFFCKEKGKKEDFNKNFYEIEITNNKTKKFPQNISSYTSNNYQAREGAIFTITSKKISFDEKLKNLPIFNGFLANSIKENIEDFVFSIKGEFSFLLGFLILGCLSDFTKKRNEKKDVRLQYFLKKHSVELEDMEINKLTSSFITTLLKADKADYFTIIKEKGLLSINFENIFKKNYLTIVEEVSGEKNLKSRVLYKDKEGENNFLKKEEKVKTPTLIIKIV